MKSLRPHFSLLLAWSLLLLLLAGPTSVQGQISNAVGLRGPDYRVERIKDGFRYTTPFPTEKLCYLYRFPLYVFEEDIKLNIYIHQGEFQLFISKHHPELMSGYLWNETLKSSDPEKTIDLKKLNPKGHQYFYIYLKSLQQNDDSSIRDQDDDTRMRNSPRYSLSVVTENSGLVLKEGVNQSAFIQSHELASFFYHSTQDNIPLKISLEYAPANPENHPIESFEASLNQGLVLRGQYWEDKYDDQKSWIGVWGDQAQAIKGDNSFSQTFVVTGENRKYRLQIENPWSFEIKITIRVYSSETSSHTLEQNFQHYGVLSDGRREKYEISPGQTGKWYLWGHSCTGTVDLNLKDEDITSGWGYDISQTLKQGEDFAHEVRIWNKGLVDRPKYLTIRKNSDEKKDDAGVLVTFTSINPESKYEEYKSVVNIERTKITYGTSTQMTVPVRTRNYPEAQASDEIKYDVRLCPYNSSHPEDEKNFCQVREECRNHTEEFMIHEQKQVTATFDNVTDGTYYIQVLATIFHGGQMVKFDREDVERVIVEVPFKVKVQNNWEKILIGFIVLMILIVVTVTGYKKWKATNEEKVFALEMNRRGYGVVGDDDT